MHCSVTNFFALISAQWSLVLCQDGELKEIHTSSASTDSNFFSIFWTPWSSNFSTALSNKFLAILHFLVTFANFWAF